MRTYMMRIVLVLAIALIADRPAHGSITVTSQGSMLQINTGGLPGTSIREFCTIWDASDLTRSTGTIFFAQSAALPISILRATTTDGGVTWTIGVSTGLTNPAGAAATDQRNPVVRDFMQTGDLTGFFGTKQGVYGGGNDANNVLFRANSTDIGVSWSGEALVTFGPSPQTLGHTGMNGFIEVFRTSSGKLRAYTAMNNITGSPLSATHLVESSDGGATWTDLGNILIDGKDNVVGANGPVFTFTDVDDGQGKMGWFMFGESAHRGVHLMISTDEGLTWTAHPALSILNATIRSGDANFISNSLVRLFYTRDISGGSPTNRSLWYEDFALAGMSNIQPNNLVYLPPPCNITVSAGNDATVYYGYPPLASTQLQATVTGGTGAVTYAWTPTTGLSNPAISNPVASPTQTTTYTITATDDNNCTATDEVLVTVKDIRCGNKNDKVSICHNGHEICVSPNAVPAHLAHGDVLGPCPLSAAGLIEGAVPEIPVAGEAKAQTPVEFMLHENYPNPFNPSTALQFDLPEPAVVTLKIYNTLGQEVATLLDNMSYNSGRHNVTFDASRLSSGVYMYRLIAGSYVSTKKMLLLK